MIAGGNDGTARRKGQQHHDNTDDKKIDAQCKDNHDAGWQHSVTRIGKTDSFARKDFRHVKKTLSYDIRIYESLIFYDIVMSENSQRIASAAPQLMAGDTQTTASQPGRSILKDLDNDGVRANARVNTGRRLRLLPALTLSACLGAGVVLLLQEGWLGARPPAVGVAASVPTEARLVTPILPDDREPRAIPAIAPSDAAPQLALTGPALIKHPETVLPTDGTESAPPTLSVAAVTPAPAGIKTAPVTEALVTKAARPKSVAQQKGKNAPPRRAERATPNSASQTTQKAAERDVDIITAIVKDIRD